MGFLIHRAIQNEDRAHDRRSAAHKERRKCLQKKRTSQRKRDAKKG